VKILLIRFSSAGDILLAGRTVATLKASGHEVYFLAKEKFRAAAEALTPHGVIAVDFNKKGALKEISGTVRNENFDAVIDLQGNYRSCVIKSGCGASKVRTATKNPIKRRLMVFFKWFLSGAHFTTVAEKYLAAVGEFIKPELKTRRLPEKKKRATEIVLHVGAKWANKRWPYFMELADRLRLIKGVHVTITGLKDEVVNSPELLYYKKRGVENLIGKTDFPGLLKVISRADVFAGNDTVAAHAASLFEVKSIIFMGPTVQQFGFVTDKDFKVIENAKLLCRPCHLHGGNMCPLGTFECMKSIDPGTAAEEIIKLSRRGK
jgi:heptosyltransferase-2